MFRSDVGKPFGYRSKYGVKHRDDGVLKIVLF